MPHNTERPAPAERGPLHVVSRAASDVQISTGDRGLQTGGGLPITIAAIQKGDGEVRITLDEFRGAPTIDVRLFEPFTLARVPMPTRKGVTMGIARLPALARALADAERQARQLGLIGGAA